MPSSGGPLGASDLPLLEDEAVEVKLPVCVRFASEDIDPVLELARVLLTNVRRYRVKPCRSSSQSTNVPRS
jgi:hypothetical protein